MSTDPSPKPDEVRAKLDLYKIRIEEFDRNYFSHRDLEWRISLQFLTGYVAVGVGYHSLKKEEAGPVLSNATVLIVGLLFLAYSAFSILHRQRLRFTRDTKNVYVRDLHKLVGLPQVADELNYKPRFANWYAFVTQVFVHLIAVVAVMAYVRRTTP